MTETTTSKSSKIQPHERFFPSTNLYSLLARGTGEIFPGNASYAFHVDNLRGRASIPTALDGVSRICNQNFSMPLDETRWNTYSLWVSGLVARLPILAIQHANTMLPQYTRDTHSNQTAGTAYLHTSLEVNWYRATLIAVCIIVGQILAVLSVLYYCNGVYTRDDSYLATAELLKTVINRFDGGKLMTGEELALSLDHVLGVPVSYGTREGQSGGLPDVDLASGMDRNFLPLPQKRRFWRNTR